ncbi:hypothetical protein EX30DRAFT_338968 [Ascodesmis nigricans]|uniref:F-box domain-containing protein n=1 Tax=Ascodesmis nigricans TaxID=341454 RepID=A0A4S2N0N3_9PEZI|nr:hypothetical protein EX30DRAFT_338968 [Ascodesmis nigricans]
MILPTCSFPTTAHTNDTIEHLPFELLHHIFLYLDPQDFDSARHVSRRWFQVSLSRQLIAQNLSTLLVGRPSSSFHGYITDFSSTESPNDEFSDSMKQLCAAFSQNIAVWPGSRHRLPCNRLELETSAIRRYGGGIIEHVCFSQGGGTFVGIVTRVGGRKEAGRKLWVNRLFSFRHSTYGHRPRGVYGGLCGKDVQVSRCMPGQLYMTMELTEKAEVMSVDIIEHPLFSGVKEIVVRFVNGQEKVTKFTEFIPVKQRVRNHLGGTETRYVDAGDHTYKVMRDVGSITGTQKAGIMAGSLRKVMQLARRKRKQWPGLEYTIPEFLGPVIDKPADALPPEQVLVQFSDPAEKQLCHCLTIPVFSASASTASVPSTTSATAETSPIRGYRVILLPSQELLITYIQSDIQNKTAVSIAYRIKAPERLTQTPGRISHLTFSPSYFYDWGSKVWWACVVAAYENGEIWLWRIDTSKLGDAHEGLNVGEEGEAELRDGETVEDTGLQSESSQTAEETPTEGTTQPEPQSAISLHGVSSTTLVACEASETQTDMEGAPQSAPDAAYSDSVSMTGAPLTLPFLSASDSTGPTILLSPLPQAHTSGPLPSSLNPIYHLSPPSPEQSGFTTIGFAPPSSTTLTSSSSWSILSTDTTATTTSPTTTKTNIQPLPPTSPITLSPSLLTISSHLSRTIKTLYMDPAESMIGAEPLLKEPQAWKVGWEPAPILRTEFVGKGQTLLVATEERVTVVEFRVREGVEKGVLRGRYG